MDSDSTSCANHTFPNEHTFPSKSTRRLVKWCTYGGSESTEHLFFYVSIIPLRRHAYSNIKKISPPKTKNFSDKNSDMFQISAQNIDCGYSLEPPRRGGSNEYPQSLFLAEIRKIMYTPVNPSSTL